MKTRDRAHTHVKQGEIKDSQAGMMRLILGRGDDSMNSLFQVSTREEVHRVSEVQHERVVPVLDETPFVVGHEHLERGDRLGPEDRDAARNENRKKKIKKIN